LKELSAICAHAHLFVESSTTSLNRADMVVDMATTKITITVPTEQVAQIRALVESGHASNTSAFVKHAISIALSDAAGWREMLSDALQQTGGPLTKKERAWADAILEPKKHVKKRKAA
jgi:Arc/MetJ-type ribon-helix-helix transcriptional regulator